MELRQLAHFIAVAEDGSFTGAARRSNIVQSGISASIAALEREIGVTLFRRTKHRVELTGAGRALLVEARRALAAAAAGRAAARAADTTITGELRIGAARATPKRVQLPRLIRELKTTNPGVDLYVRERRRVDCSDLRSGELDLVIGPSPNVSGVTSILLESSPMMLAVPDSHPLASRPSVRLSDAADEQFIDLPKSWVTHRLAQRALSDAGIERRRIVEVSSVDFVLLLIADGIGISLLPEIVADYAHGVRFVPLSTPVGAWECFVSFLGDEPATPVAKAFLDLLQINKDVRWGATHQPHGRM